MRCSCKRSLRGCCEKHCSQNGLSHIMDILAGAYFSGLQKERSTPVSLHWLDTSPNPCGSYLILGG